MISIKLKNEKKTNKKARRKKHKLVKLIMSDPRLLLSAIVTYKLKNVENMCKSFLFGRFSPILFCLSLVFQFCRTAVLLSLKIYFSYRPKVFIRVLRDFFE